MHKKLIVGVVLMIVVAFSAVGRAHGGHTHKVMGTVASIQGTHVDIKATDGKVVTVMLDSKTAITRGKTKLDATALKPGERVSVDYMQEKSMNMATAVKLAATPVGSTK